MKILKEGKIPERKPKETEIVYKHTCHNCGCEFECCEDETEKVVEVTTKPSLFAFGAGRDIIEDEYTQIKCPYCDKVNILKITNISKDWKRWLEN